MFACAEVFSPVLQRTKEVESICKAAQPARLLQTKERI